MQVSDPRGLTWEEWSAALISDNGIAMDPPAEENWQGWAATLQDQINAALPNPYAGFAAADGWTAWALSACPVLQSLDVAAPEIAVEFNTQSAAAALTYAGVGPASSQGLLSIWFYLAATGGVDGIFRQGATINNRFIVNRDDSTGEFSIALANTAGVNQYSALATEPGTITNAWAHLLVSYDVGFAAGARIVQCAVNGVLTPPVPFVDIGAAMSITGTLDISMGGSLSFGCVGQVWYGMGQFLDLTVPANIALFVNPTGPEPVNLGANGEIPTGVSPTIFLNGAGAAFLTNDGTAGGTFAGGSGACGFLPP